MHCCAEYLEERSNCQPNAIELTQSGRKHHCSICYCLTLSIDFIWRYQEYTIYYSFITGSQMALLGLIKYDFQFLSAYSIPSVCLVYALYLSMWKSLKIFFQFLSFNIYFYVCFAIVNLQILSFHPCENTKVGS